MALALAVALAGCSTAPTATAPARLASAPSGHTTGAGGHAPPDWFHRELALARRARATHLPPGDKAGAQRAYYAVMLPACRKVAQSGPEAYRARCRAMADHAAADAAAANDDFACMDEHADNQDSEAEKTACND